ncbi:MFS transporter [Cupriavidus necator]|uniref:MFS transporter n=1 Tax=Cupriavidus necator TaxID=106590 RepID=A0A1U9UMY4_CUPNE|nr:MFS transporter [Cupriavidus necator]AQV94084.1 MFS transporter [Cupriavidus necator]
MKSNSTFAPGREWMITGLLCLFMAINFADKAVLGLVAVPLMQELQLSPAQFGSIASGFFLLFAISGVLVGFLSNRVSTKILLLVMAIIWSVSQLPLALAPSVPLLFASRILLGAGEGPAYPVAIHALYKWFPDQRRNLPTSIVMQGSQIGLLVAGPLVTICTLKYGWRAAFLVLAAVGALWALAWWCFGAEGANKETSTIAKNPEKKVSYVALIFDRTILGNMLAFWAAYWLITLTFTWIPSYLQKVMHFDALTAGWLFSAFVAINIPIVIGGSWLSQRLLKRGMSSRVARVGLGSVSTCAGGLLILLAVTQIDDRLVKTLLLAVGCGLPQVAIALSATILAEIVPSPQRGAMLAISNSVGTTAGVLAPVVTGFLIQGVPDLATGYSHGLTLAAGLALFAGVLGGLLMNPATSKRRFSVNACEEASALVSDVQTKYPSKVERERLA